jgi:ubiquinone/menaquinone biosynthesis C-methylase UbiE
LFKNTKYDTLLEIGYGSGIFIPTLTEFASEIYGLDVHLKNKEVEQILLKYGVKTNLFSSSATNIPFEDNFFDIIISISAIEFIDNLDLACKEVLRVMKDNGVFIVITPGYSPLLDFGLKILTKQSAKADYENRRKFILPTLLKNFNIKNKITFPRFMIRAFRLYNGLELIKK